MYINSIGYYVPTERVDNEYFEKLNGLPEGWILPRTGIKTRSKAAPDENVDTMAIDAIENALPALPYDIKDVDLIIAAHYCAYDTVATAAHEAQAHYGITGAKVFYMSSACSSFINGLETVEAFFQSGKAKRALLICSEHNTYYSNERDPKSGHLWGDAAVAYFLSPDKVAPTDVEVVALHTEGLGNVGKGPDGVKLRPREEGITMPDGRDVFIHACRYMIYSLNETLREAGVQIADIDKIICHQANKRIVAQVAHQLDLGLDRFLNNIEELGNTGSASAALVLAQHRDGFEPGALVALTVFGGGYSCGSALLKL